jgi:hypothetical protein
MVSLKTVGHRFYTTFKVLEGGTGIIHGELTETEQSAQPSYVFVQPRHVLRTNFPTAVRTGMVLQTKAGDKFIVGDNGPSEGRTGVIWQSFRLIEATGQYTWYRRTKIINPITRVAEEGIPQNLGLIWAALEPMDRVQFDREIHFQFPQSRVITGAPIHNDDLIDNRAVSKLDKQLGLSIGLVT